LAARVAFHVTLQHRIQLRLDFRLAAGFDQVAQLQQIAQAGVQPSA
jgi:hypothetical protein